MNRILVIILAIVSTSCIQTKYGPMNYKGGYKDLKIAEDMYELSVYGNAYADKNTIREFFLYRSAELTLENGGKYFLLLGDKSDKRPITITGLLPTSGNYSVYAISGTKYSNKGYVKILTEKPERDGIYYDAALIKGQLGDGVNKSLREKRGDKKSLN